LATEKIDTSARQRYDSEAARQRKVHGNGPTHRTEKIRCTANALGIAVQRWRTAKQPLPSVFEKTHGKEAFA
jgi:hypothetical protein